MPFSLLKHYNNGICLSAHGLWGMLRDFQAGNTESCFGRTLCSTSISATSKNMRSGDNISKSAINYKGWHIYIIIMKISFKLKDIKHAALCISFLA